MEKRSPFREWIDRNTTSTHDVNICYAMRAWLIVELERLSEWNVTTGKGPLDLTAIKETLGIL